MKLKFLSPKIHGIGDYAAAIVLIVAPSFLGIGEQSMVAHWISVAGGVGLVAYSLLTDYAFSAASVISFKFHLWLDTIAGVAFIALPFLLGIDGLPRWYLLAMGAGVLLVVLVSKPKD